METIFRAELNIFGIFLSIVVIFLFYNQIEMKKKEEKLFIMLAFITLVELVLDLIFWLIDGKIFTAGVGINYVVNSVYYVLQILQCYVLMKYVGAHMRCDETKVKKILLCIPVALGTILIFLNIFTNCVFGVDSSNVYYRTWGVYGWIYAICSLIYIPISMVMVLRKMIRGDSQLRRDGVYLLAIILIPVISAVLQMKVYGLNFIWAGMALMQLMIFVQVEVKNYKRMIHEITEQRIQIMLSQIQPHFLYNSLTAIHSLCDINPKLAKQAIGDFSQYLRTNIDSIYVTVPVTFERELKHVQTYLKLEKMRFEDELQIIYDIEVTDFMIPALTVQPLVENAVKYGIGKKEDGGTVIIVTREYDDRYEIIVSDDGVGFDVYETQEDGRSHVGIDNVKTRLWEMIKATLDIRSEKGIGTKATITIRKEAQNEDISD